MKKVLLLLLLISVSASSFAASFEMDTVKFDCHDLGFTLNLSTNTATFHNITHFGIGEMIADVPIGFTWKKNSAQVKYNWYHTTVIKIDFPNKMYQMEPGKSVDITVSFDDGDGIYQDNKKVTCEVK